MLAEKYIREYNNLDGKPATREKLVRLLNAIKGEFQSRRIDKHSPFGLELHGIQSRLATALKSSFNEVEVVRVQKISIDKYVKLEAIAPKKRVLVDDATTLIYGLPCGPQDGEEGELSGLGFTRDGQKKIYDMITGMILGLIKEKGDLPWRKPWAIKQILATNFKTRTVYKGANLFLLNLIAPMFYGKTGPYWLTYKQTKELGGQVRKGASGFPVIYYNIYYTVTKPEKKSITEEEFKAMNPEVKQERGAMELYTINYYTVFAQQDIDGIEFPAPAKKREATPIETAQNIVDNMPKRPPIIHHSIGRAFYSPDDDKVSVPELGYFHSDQEYYSTLFHELIHSTGHKSRLDRKFGVKKGDSDYAFEELIAEMGASYLNAQAGILYYTLNNSAAYVKGWQTKLEDAMKSDNKFFLKASAKAAKAADFILGDTVVASDEKIITPEQKPEFIDDIPKDLAYRAYAWTSFSPEKRGESARQEYVETLQQFIDTIRPLAEKVNRLEEYEKDFDRFRLKLKALTIDFLSAHSRVASAMITGPAKFPTERNRKRMNSADSKMSELLSYQKRVLKILKLKYLPDELKPVKTGQSNALEILEAKLADREKSQRMMTEANKIIRSKKEVENRLTAYFKEIGIADPEKLTREVLQPSYTGRVGFAPYQLQNNNAEIARLKKRIEQEKNLSTKREGGNVESTFEGGTILKNYEINRLQIFFSNHPSSDTITRLKRRGFKWSPSNKAWQRFLNTTPDHLVHYVITGDWETKKATEKVPEPEAEMELAGPKRKRKATGLLGAEDIASMKFTKLNLTEPYLHDFNRLYSDTMIMLWAAPGSGKTVYALNFGQYLAEKLNMKVLYVAKEEMNRSTFTEKIIQFKIGHPNLKFTKELVGVNVDEFDAIIFDSVQALGMDLAAFQQFVKEHPGKLLVPIIQSTKDGDFRGGKDWEHEVDIAGEIVDRKFVARKNRLDEEFAKKREKHLLDQAVAEQQRKELIKGQAKPKPVEAPKAA